MEAAGLPLFSRFKSAISSGFKQLACLRLPAIRARDFSCRCSAAAFDVLRDRSLPTARGTLTHQWDGVLARILLRMLGNDAREAVA